MHLPSPRLKPRWSASRRAEPRWRWPTRRWTEAGRWWAWRASLASLSTRASLSGTASARAGSATLRGRLNEAAIGWATEGARYEGKFITDDVVVSAIGILRRHTDAPVAFIEITGSGNILPIGDKSAVIHAARSIV